MKGTEYVHYVYLIRTKIFNTADWPVTDFRLFIFNYRNSERKPNILTDAITGNRKQGAHAGSPYGFGTGIVRTLHICSKRYGPSIIPRRGFTLFVCESRGKGFVQGVFFY
jgi:hypothetical protein